MQVKHLRKLILFLKSTMANEFPLPYILNEQKVHRKDVLFSTLSMSSGIPMKSFKIVLSRSTEIFFNIGDLCSSYNIGIYIGEY